MSMLLAFLPTDSVDFVKQTPSLSPRLGAAYSLPSFKWTILRFLDMPCIVAILPVIAPLKTLNVSLNGPEESCCVNMLRRRAKEVKSPNLKDERLQLPDFWCIPCDEQWLWWTYCLSKVTASDKLCWDTETGGGLCVNFNKNTSKDIFTLFT